MRTYDLCRAVLTNSIQDAPLSKIIAAVSKSLNVPENKVKLSFDGQVLNPMTTPLDHDMEDEDMLDAVIKKNWANNDTPFDVHSTQKNTCKINRTTPFEYIQRPSRSTSTVEARHTALL